MRPVAHGVSEDRGFLWTPNRVPGHRVYGERLRARRGTEYRHWNPYRSKMAALLQCAPATPWVQADDDILYLGAASGTTVSHLSDVTDGTVYAVESSSRSARDLVWNTEPRQNVVPILEDAGRPQRYAAYLATPADVLVQDVAQRHQVDIFLRNVPLVRSGGRGFLFVKARSIRVAGAPEEIYRDVRLRLEEAGLRITLEAPLAPFEKDHQAFVAEVP